MELPEIQEDLEKSEHDKRCKALREGRKDRQIFKKCKLMTLEEVTNMLAAL